MAETDSAPTEATLYVCQDCRDGFERPRIRANVPHVVTQWPQTTTVFKEYLTG